ncbi:hypothetical protein V8E51_010494 [Hyaloscypha variabilis]
MSSGASNTKKVHYERGTKGKQDRHRSSRDSGVGSSSASDRAAPDTAPDYSFPLNDEKNISVFREALDAANEKIKELQAANAKLSQALAESHKENRLLKREKVQLLNKLDDAIDDLENERRMSRGAREGSPNKNSGRSPPVPRSTRTGPDETISSMMRDEKTSSAKSIDLAVISQPTRFFQVGRVFKTLWTEPAGETATDTDKEYYRPVGYGQLSFTKMRRFVVVRKRLHSCLCLAISTYGGQGSAKKDSRSEDHAVVYASQDPPPSDDEFTKEPIPVIIEETSETIDPKSVIDFGRVYTVEHNVKVLNVGRVAKSDKKRLDQYFTDTIGMSPDLEDEGYGGDTPTSRPESRADRRQSSAAPRGSFNTPNPMANPFTPSMRTQLRPISYHTQPPAGYVPGQVPVPTAYVVPVQTTYAIPTPTTRGHFPPPRAPEAPSKYPPNDGYYHPYPI